MIVPDVNLLVYAYNEDAPHHAEAKRWWEELLNSDTPVALPWVSALGFIRLMTHRAVLRTPIAPAQAAELAIEHEAELCSNDADFGRFPGLRWRNPL